MPSAHVTAAAALALFSSALVVGSASAQMLQTGQPTPYVYGNLGFGNHLVADAELYSIDGRVGARINNWFGVEGEAGFGVNRRGLHRGESVRINNQQALYGVAYLPLTPAFDLFGRLGVGRTDFDYAGPAPQRSPDASYNIGAGGQWFLDPNNGVRVDFTMESFNHQQNADTWGISYVRKF